MISCTGWSRTLCWIDAILGL